MKIPIAIALLLLTVSAHAHRGRLDSYGCHHNRKAKVYGCHKGEFAGKTFTSKRAMIAAKEGLDTQTKKAPATFKAKVISVIDGDTLDVLYKGEVIRIRLADIDAPEMSQPYGPEARQFVVEQASGKIVQLEVEGTGVFGRTVATIILPDDRSLNREIMKAGLAWWNKKYSNNTTFGILEAKARLSQKGLWESAAFSLPTTQIDP